jgi:hypothetical protein
MKEEIENQEEDVVVPAGALEVIINQELKKVLRTIIKNRIILEIEIIITENSLIVVGVNLMIEIF